MPGELHEMPDGMLLVSEPVVSSMFQAWAAMGFKVGQTLLDQWQDAWMRLAASQCAHLSERELKQFVHEAGLRNTLVIKGVAAMQ